MFTATTRLALVVLAFTSTAAFASEGDLKTFERLGAIGFASETFHGQTFVGLDTISCAYAHATGETECSARDVAANGGEGAAVTLNGERAAALLSLLSEMNAPTESGMGHLYVSAQEIRCHQTLPGVDDASAADRTQCSIDLAE